MTTHDEPRPGDTDDLVWLADRQPRPELGSDAAARAREALLAHMEAPTASSAAERVAPTVHTAPLRTETFSVKAPGRGWVKRTAVAAALAAVAATVLFGALPSGKGGAGGALAPAAAEAAPLVKLARTISTTPEPSGDATLTLEHSVVSGENGGRFTKYNLVLDGRFRQFFGATLEQLRDAKSGTSTSTGLQDYGRGTMSGWIQAAADSAKKSPEQAAAAIEAASGIPIVAPSKDPKLHERQRTSQYNNHVWITALSVLQMSGGRPDVRAGALAAMAGVGAVTTDAVEDGRAVLKVSLRQNITATSSEQFDEALTIDAHTGVPVRYEGGSTGEEPSTVSTFEVSRVDAADYGH